MSGKNMVSNSLFDGADIFGCQQAYPGTVFPQSLAGEIPDQGSAACISAPVRFIVFYGTDFVPLLPQLLFANIEVDPMAVFLFARGEIVTVRISRRVKRSMVSGSGSWME